ncbi:MAG: MotA/TolQ/ExbB proton channel family protein [Gammaproteobacteria bacterium]|jgi:chemotaxis protein MotA|nr:MotA/TolQ/ExbB proton channel family protein [Gammaproteobacteria bacterium]
MRIRLDTARQSTVIGLASGGLIVLAMLLIAPSQIGLFINIPGLLVVVGGTLAATVVSRPVADVVRVLRGLPELATDVPVTAHHEIDQLQRVAEYYRHGYVRAAEQELERVTNPFLRTGMQLVIDRGPVQDLVKLLQWRIAGLRAREQSDAQIVRTMATLTPAFGMVGTLFGLVHMLSGLGASGLSEIGGSMAFAMSSTLYGILLANLVLKPLAIKMERRTQQRLVMLQMLQEGILMLYEKSHPTLIREALEAYLTHQQDAADATTLALPKVA